MLEKEWLKQQKKNKKPIDMGVSMPYIYSRKQKNI